LDGLECFTFVAYQLMFASICFVCWANRPAWLSVIIDISRNAAYDNELVKLVRNKYEV
jgi:hypothetical protein